MSRRRSSRSGPAKLRANVLLLANSSNRYEPGSYLRLDWASSDFRAVVAERFEMLEYDLRRYEGFGENRERLACEAIASAVRHLGTLDALLKYSHVMQSNDFAARQALERYRYLDRAVHGYMLECGMV